MSKVMYNQKQLKNYLPSHAGRALNLLMCHPGKNGLADLVDDRLIIVRPLCSILLTSNVYSSILSAYHPTIEGHRWVFFIDL